jgi:hypothetical protein
MRAHSSDGRIDRLQAQQHYPSRNSVKDGAGRRLIAIYPNRMYIENTPPGLMSYGTVFLDQYLTAGLALADVYNGTSGVPPTTAAQRFELVVSQGQWGAALPGVPFRRKTGGVE